MMCDMVDPDNAPDSSSNPPQAASSAASRRRTPKTPNHTPAQRLEAVRRYRVRTDRDLSMGFLSEQFNRQIKRPYRQLGGVAEIWQRLVPAELAAHTRLVSLARGTLTIAVNSSARLYTLDAMLRRGLESELISTCRGAAVRRVRLRQENFS